MNNVATRFDWILLPLEELSKSPRQKKLHVKIGPNETQPLILSSGTPLLEVVYQLHSKGILRFRGSLINDAKRWEKFKSVNVEIIGNVSLSTQLGRALSALVEGEL